ncbi:hypothetical protein BKA00_005816 [Actinomadura coerulea]|uniref:Uncharacterized protein n=1 Tax=Actinomadura coerulea TaxID=46159 RepID=A0A7X0G539_9ACTN|nr:hypothetical protein [Actinomadura coerulea]MBB6398902.1 hypothetical protein [Actinomadura coerulea]GGP98395.1 hypothetical protein GCM10010187_12510 [Actinomadura coerulea]
MSQNTQNGPGVESRPARRSARWTADGALIVRHRRSGVAELDDIRPGALRAWASACWHLREAGTTPLPPAHVVRALARRGWW